jgi:hypothetical protein
MLQFIGICQLFTSYSNIKRQYQISPPSKCTSWYVHRIADVTKSGLAAGSVQDLQTGYANQGWRADDAVLAALACVDMPADLEAVTVATRAIYLPWLEDSARYLQKLVDGSTYPGGTIASSKPFVPKKGECVLFVDGLRFDAARRLAALLEARGCDIAETVNWTSLPSVTATGKAAVSPVRGKIGGADDQLSNRVTCLQSQCDVEPVRHSGRAGLPNPRTFFGELDPATFCAVT